MNLFDYNRLLSNTQSISRIERNFLLIIDYVVVVLVCLLWHFSAAYELIVQSSLVLLHLLQNS